MKSQWDRVKDRKDKEITPQKEWSVESEESKEQEERKRSCEVSASWEFLLNDGPTLAPQYQIQVSR